MPDRSPELNAAVRAVRGESDLDAVWSALVDERLARVIACAPDADPVVRAVAALCGRLSDLLDPSIVADPALHVAMARLIGTRAGREALRVWAEVAPAGWGRAHAAALIDEVRRSMCDADVAAALIGPCDDAAALLACSRDAAFAIRCWGRSDPAAPTAWRDALSPKERLRLLTQVRHDPSAIAACLPWLPPNIVRAAGDAIPVRNALDAFAAASPTVRTRHGALLRRLVDRALPMHLDDLTRLACATGAKTVWRRVQTLIQASPEDAWRVVVAAPWDDLPENVRAAIMTCADRSPVCAAVAAARGDGRHGEVTHFAAIAFFAALDPDVWDALDADIRQRWRHALPHGYLHPNMLTWEQITDGLAPAVRRHARNEDAWRAALLPVALRTVAPAEAHALIAAMPTPPRDSGAFFVVASGHDDPSVIARARSALRTPGDLACAIALQRSGDIRSKLRARCAALRRALRGRSHDDVAPILALLTDDARAALLPDPDALVARLAHPDRRDALRRMVDRLTALPPEIAIPSRFALHQWETGSAYAQSAADALADALCGHGDLFVALADALADERLRAALLPLPEDVALADALRNLAQDDLPTARRLAHAIQDHDRSATLQALLAAPPQHAVAVWQALDNDALRAIGAGVDLSPSDGDPPVIRDPIVAIALTALQSGDDNLRMASVTVLAARPDVLRAIWMTLPLEVRQMLRTHPAVADLLPSMERSARSGIRRGRA